MDNLAHILKEVNRLEPVPTVIHKVLELADDPAHLLGVANVPFEEDHAPDPTRAVFILTCLFVVGGGSLLLFALRAPSMVQGSDFKGVSRETLLLINNLMLTVIAAMVLTGTLYPLLLDALDAGKISVGPPYFSLMFAILMVPIALLLPPAFYSKWQEDSVKRLAGKLVIPAVLAVLTGIVTAVWLPSAGGWGIAGSAAAAWCSSRTS